MQGMSSTNVKRAGDTRITTGWICLIGSVLATLASANTPNERIHLHRTVAPGTHHAVTFVYTPGMIEWQLTIWTSDGWHHKPGAQRGWANIWERVGFDGTQGHLLSCPESGWPFEWGPNARFSGDLIPIEPKGQGPGSALPEYKIDGNANVDSAFLILPTESYRHVDDVNGAQLTAYDASGQIIDADWWEPIEGVSFDPTSGIESEAVKVRSTNTGTVVVSASPHGNTNLTATATIHFYRHELIEETGAVEEHLSIGLWENAFDNPMTSPNLKQNFLDLDERRFYVRLQGMPNENSQVIRLHLSTESPDEAYQHAESAVELYPADDGLRSRSLLLVADAVDAAVTPGRTIISMLGSTVRARAVSPDDENTVSAGVPAETIKTISIRPVIVRYFDGIYRSPELAANVLPCIDICRSIYAQTAIQVNAQAVSSHNQPNFGWDGWKQPSPPNSMGLYMNMFTVEHEVHEGEVSETARILIDALGAKTPLTVFFVESIGRLTTTFLDGSKNYNTAAYGAAMFPHGFPNEDGADRMGFAFIRGSLTGGAPPHAMAHELGHILTNHGHHEHRINIMHAHPPWNGQVTDGKRWTEGQQQTIRGSNYVD